MSVRLWLSIQPIDATRELNLDPPTNSPWVRHRKLRKRMNLKGINGGPGRARTFDLPIMRPASESLNPLKLWCVGALRGCLYQFPYHYGVEPLLITEGIK